MMRGALALPRTVWLLGLVSLINDAASDMIYPLVPLYLAGVLLAGPKALGIIEGLAEALGSLLKLFAGVLADRVRHLRGWVVAGYAVSGLVRPLIALSTSWLGVLACRLGDRVGKGLRSAPRDALLTLSVAPQQRGLAFGLHRAMDNLGAVIGPLLAAGLLGLGFGLREVFFWSLVPAVLVVVLTLLIREPERSVAPPRPFRWNLSDQPRALRRYLIVLGLFTLGNSSNLFLLLRARELGLSDAQVPLVWALVCGVAAVAGPPLSAWSDRLDRRRFIVAGWGVYALFYLVFGLLPAQPALLWPLFAAYGLFLAATEGAEKAFVADLVPGDQAGTAFGWYHLVSGILLLPASLLFGWLWADVTPLAAFAFGAAAAAAAALLLAFWVVPRPADTAA